MVTRRRAEEAQRQQILQRMGNGTPGQPHVRSSVRDSRTLTSAVLRLRPRPRLRKPKARDRDSPHNSQLRTMVLQGLKSTARLCRKYAHKSTSHSNSGYRLPIPPVYLPNRFCRYRLPSSGSWQPRTQILPPLAQLSTPHISPQVLLSERRYHLLSFLIPPHREHQPHRTHPVHRRPHSTQDTPSLRRIYPIQLPRDRTWLQRYSIHRFTGFRSRKSKWNRQCAFNRISW